MKNAFNGTDNELLKNRKQWYDYKQGLKGGFMTRYKIVVEKHPDGYVAYPLGIKGVVVG